MSTRRAGLLALAVVGAIRCARAQAPSGQIGASAVLVNVGMTITTLRNLDFGTVPKGVPTTVDPAGASSGAWQVTGTANALVSIAFTLPANLNNTQAVPGVTLPVSFGGTAARWRRSVNDPAGATAFDPSVGTTGRFGPPPNPTLYVWLGGTVSPAAGQLPGIYTNNVIVTLAYL